MTICIYHGNCPDGFGGAWAIRKALGEKNVEFFPGAYQKAAPDVSGQDVIFVDFAYKLPVMEQLRDQAKSIIILDHHKTAAEGLANFECDTKVFDMNRSGARIAWDYYFPNQSAPQTLLHIEDRDLWRFALNQTREVMANVFSYPYKFELWDELMNTDPLKLIEEGRAIERNRQKDVEELSGIVVRKMRIADHIVPIANVPYTLVSDMGARLAKDQPFAGCYWDTPYGRVFGLRSTENGMDVSKVAEQYGGGGHKHAAGFTVSFAQAATFEL